MKPEPLEDDEELDEAFDALDTALAEPEPDEPPAPALSAEALPVPAVTSSPTAPDTDAIVPALGAKSFVPARADLSLLTVSSALDTAAWAEAMFAASVACVTAESVDVVVLFDFAAAGFVVVDGVVEPSVPLAPVVPPAALVPLAPVAPLAPDGPR
jgi:hypothetical protein